MPRYYGVIRNQKPDSYLEHYGVRGMKWGVRKARERGDDAALSRQYKKAQAKLKKLEKKSNWIRYDLRRRRNDLGAKIPIYRTLTLAKLRSKRNDWFSGYGSEFRWHRMERFKKKMNEAFKGTKYDAHRLERQENMKQLNKKKNREKKVNAIKQKLFRK